MSIERQDMLHGTAFNYIVEGSGPVQLRRLRVFSISGYGSGRDLVLSKWQCEELVSVAQHFVDTCELGQATDMNATLSRMANELGLMPEQATADSVMGELRKVIDKARQHDARCCGERAAVKREIARELGITPNDADTVKELARRICRSFAERTCPQCNGSGKVCGK